MKNLAIFASGSGTNAENIAKLFHQGNQIRVAVVLCNRKNVGVYARMEALGVPVIYIPSAVWDNDPSEIVETLRPYDIDLVVLAGFMRTVRPEIINAYKGRIVNIHPSLLPAYGGKGMYGHHVHEAVIAAGEKKSGVTVHYVTDEIDGGQIVMQQSVDILPEDTAETLEAKIHPVEYSLYPRAIVAALSAQEDAGEKREEAVKISEDTPQTRSVDEAWADVLNLKYNEKEAAELRARKEVAARSQTVSQTPPVNGVRPVNAIRQPEVSGDSKPDRISPAPNNSTQVPKSYMLPAILVTIFCCTIPGVVAIVYSSSVNSRMMRGDVAGAAKASARAQGWIIASFVLGLLSATLMVPVTLISSLL